MRDRESNDVAAAARLAAGEELPADDEMTRAEADADAPPELEPATSRVYDPATRFAWITARDRR